MGVDGYMLCRYLVEEICFSIDRIVPCGSRFWDNGQTGQKFFLNPLNEDFNVDKYFELTDKYIKQYNNASLGNSTIPEFCINCIHYEPFIDDNNKNNRKFKKINIFNQTRCNCACIYCCLCERGNLDLQKKLNQFKSYDIKPMLKKLDENNLVDSGTKISIFGGECTLYPKELDYVIKWGMSHSCSFEIMTNGIIFNKSIEKLLKNGSVMLQISIDSGTRNTFNRIKRVNKFDTVCKNIEKYSKASSRKTMKEGLIVLKYIIIPDINDNIGELKSFFQLAEKYNINRVLLSFDRYWVQENIEKNISRQIKELIKYFIYAKEFDKLKRNIDYSEVSHEWLNRVLQH